MSQPNLFVALSTGQNIANILPILELVGPDDRVLWVETKTAQVQQWGKWACDLLRRHGLSHIMPLQLPDDAPASLYQALAGHAAVRDPSHKIKLIANGGTKLQMIAAFRALNGRLDEVLYSHDHPCVLERQRYDRDQPVESNCHPYRRHSIDLTDILACSGRELVAAYEQRLWPNQPQLTLPRYGQDPEYTRDCHQRIADWVKDHPDAPKKAFAYRRAAQLVPEEAERLRCEILKACGLPTETPLNETALEAIYNRTHRLDRLAWEFQHKYGSPTEDIPDLGRELEQAVAARLVRWLGAHPEFAAIVQSVWQNVRIRLQQGGEDLAELDVALLLKNGVLLALECKAFEAQIKDMNSRLNELQRSASQLARIAICVPSYPAFAKDPWHQALAQNIERMRRWTQFRLIEFTLPDQPGLGGKTFETALEEWLRSYLPKSSASP